MTRLIQNVSPKRWREMCERSAALLARAESYRRFGSHARADEIWLTLRPLNRMIRSLCTLPADGSEPRIVYDRYD